MLCSWGCMLRVTYKKKPIFIYSFYIFLKFPPRRHIINFIPNKKDLLFTCSGQILVSWDDTDFAGNRNEMYTSQTNSVHVYSQQSTSLLQH